MTEPLNIVILGLSITSSWGNGHASTYRGLVGGLARNGHRILFLERDMPWYADNRDDPNPASCRTEIYASFTDLVQRFGHSIEEADLVILGSYVPEGIRVGHWLVNTTKGRTMFYDIDTPVTLSLLEHQTAEYIDRELVRKFQAYLSFTGGPTLRRIETQYGSPMARALYCAVDVNTYRPQTVPQKWTMGYLGTYSADRQPTLHELLVTSSRRCHRSRFAVAGPQYPKEITWPENVDRMFHLAPREHPTFYGSQAFTLNITRAAMRKAGYAPSVRLFEAGACATAVISDSWQGLESIFEVGNEILVAEDSEDVLRILRDTPPAKRNAIGRRLRARVLAEHSPAARAKQIEHYFEEIGDHVSASPARRHRSRRTYFGGVSNGVAAQFVGKTAG